MFLNYWRRDLNYLFVALTELLWLVPLIELLNSSTIPELYPRSLTNVFVLVSANLMSALLLRRYMIYRQMSTREQFPYLIGGVVAGIVLTLAVFPMLTEVADRPNFNLIDAYTQEVRNYFPYGVIFTPIVILLWARGFYIGRIFLTHINVAVQMRLGIIVYFLLGTIGTRELQDDMLTLLPLFFGSALMSTALARSSTLQIEEDLRRERFGLSWVGIMFVAVGLITLGGFVMALFIAGVDRDKVLDVLSLVGAGILTLIFIILTPIFWLGEQFYRALDGLIQEEPVQIPIESGQREPLGQANDVDRLEYGAILEALSNMGSYIVIGIMAMTVLIVIFFWISAFLHRDDYVIGDEEHESLETREVVGGLRRAIGNQLKKLGGAFSMVRQFGVGRGLVGVLTIRFAYARMEREAKKRGFPRDCSKTPYEFRLIAVQAFPGGEMYIRTITEAYVAIRYGEVPENNDELDAVRNALDELMDIPAPA